jgi:hypothetical protein
MRSLRAVVALSLVAVLSGCPGDTASSAPEDDAGSRDAGAPAAEPVVDAGEPDASTECRGAGAACASGGECCSSRCVGVDAGESRCEAAPFCAIAGESCVRASDCCQFACNDGLCGTSAEVPGTDGGTTLPLACVVNGNACGAASDCCSGTCTSGSCAPVPGATCGTLGQLCTSGADCCSTNCQSGRCAKAYTCQAAGDLCFSNTDCCGGVCSAADGGAGVCTVPAGLGSGGCRPLGQPCFSGENCCSRLCLDAGGGAKVCAPTSGCRMTGELCHGDTDCCGSDTSRVICSLFTTDPPSGRCTNPRGCQPVGNICGAYGANARQDCCDGHKAVCELTSEGVARCYGGCPSGRCDRRCPNGYASENPDCCIAEGESCEFRDQCCDRLPCLPDAQGSLRCTRPAQPPPDAGTAPDAGSTPADGGSASPDAGSVADGGSTSVDGGRPDAGPVDVCQPTGTICTSSGDCCYGLTCSVPAGASVGSCVGGSACGGSGQACRATTDCCGGLLCVDTTGRRCLPDGTGCFCALLLAPVP